MADEAEKKKKFIAKGKGKDAMPKKGGGPKLNQY